MKKTHRIYLDWNATTPCLPQVRQCMSDVMASVTGNPSSLHAEGRHARGILEDARRRIAACLGADPDGVIFTSGGTEANHLALRLHHPSAGSRDTPHYLASNIEHASLREPLRKMVAAGMDVTLTGCSADGDVVPLEISEAMRDTTAWISVMLVNNETGVIQPVQDIAGIAHGAGALIHTDAVQALGRIPLTLDQYGVDAMSLSAHKIGGPAGIGALVLRRGVDLDPLFLGGVQEGGRRAGTEYVAGAAGFALATEIAVTKPVRETQRLHDLRDGFEANCLRDIQGVHINGARDRRVPHTSNLSFDGCLGVELAAELDQAGYAVSVGSACHAGDRRPSHVLEAMCLTPGRCRGAVRFSFGHTTESAAIARLGHDLPAMVKRLREVS